MHVSEPFPLFLTLYRFLSSKLLPTETGCHWWLRGCLMPSLRKTPCTAALNTHTLNMQLSFGLHSSSSPELSVRPVRGLFSFRPTGKPQKHNALHRKGFKGDGLKIWGNSLVMTEALAITGSLHCLMPNGSLRLRHNGQLPTETQWTLCQFTIILSFVTLHSTNMPLFTDLWIIQLKLNAMTHFWSKSHHQGEEAFSRRCVAFQWG